VSKKLKSSEVPFLDLEAEELTFLNDPKRLARGVPDEEFGKDKSGPSLLQEAVYTFPGAVLDDGGPLIFRGTLEAARLKHAEVMVAAWARLELAREAANIAIGKEPSEAEIIPLDTTKNVDRQVTDQQLKVDEQPAA
jgi:hypothetical protein